jgi:hypothetical protein
MTNRERISATIIVVGLVQSLTVRIDVFRYLNNPYRRLSLIDVAWNPVELDVPIVDVPLADQLPLRACARTPRVVDVEPP